jgi:hypothetical protein
MPATTTLKLPVELKERITPLAESAGKSPHAWMVEALEQQAVAADGARVPGRGHTRLPERQGRGCKAPSAQTRQAMIRTEQ